MALLDGVEAPLKTWMDGTAVRGRYWLGPGTNGIEVVHVEAASRPTVTSVRATWHDRHAKRPSPVLLMVEHAGRMWLCGPVGDTPPVIDVDPDHAERIARGALEQPDRHAATRFVADALDIDPDGVPGLTNRGLLATHELHTGVPARDDWNDATDRAARLLGARGRQLVEQLGFDIDGADHARHALLRTGTAGNARAVAVFLQQTEEPDAASARFDNTSPLAYALTQADQAQVPWVLSVQHDRLRLYATATSGSAGQRGRTETYTALDLTLLPSDQAGYLDLLFSAAALQPGGTLDQIRDASTNFAAGLSERLRERVYSQVVPRLALAVAARDDTPAESKDDLDRHFHTAVMVLFRLLFIAYAEDQQLLPSGRDPYRSHSLKAAARDIADIYRTGGGAKLGFDDPFTDVTEAASAANQTSTDLWDRCQALFVAVDKGRDDWQVPVYNGGLFSPDADHNPAGPAIAGLSLTNAEFGPALTALLVDVGPDGTIGPIDFRSLSVREFGTIYEGLLESELARADQDLTTKKDPKRGDVYVPATGDTDVVVAAGDVYLHNASGARKATGSYFTKPFAVDHLVSTAVLPTLDDHLERVTELLDAGDEVGASELLFDFRVADIAMGSGHFLTAVVDAIEARLTEFLAAHPLPHVEQQLALLRNAARANLGDNADTVDIERSALLRRLVAKRCVYGVDINPVSVELARVAMWIHTFVPGLPLSFLDHNLQCGDSLTGIGTVQEAVDELLAADGSMGLFDDFVRAEFDKATDPLKRLAATVDATTDDIETSRAASNDARDALSGLADLFDLLVAHRLGKVGKPVLTSLDDLHAGQVTKAREAVGDLNVLHFPLAFPEVFSRDRAGFDALVGNPPWDKVRHETQQFWCIREPGLNALPQDEREKQIPVLREQRPLEAAAERAEMSQRRLLQDFATSSYRLQGRGHHDFAKLFLERALNLAGSEGAIGLVLPRQAMVLGGWSQLREALVSRGSLSVTQARNKSGWFFDEVHNSYMVAMPVSRGSEDACISVHPAVTSPEQLRHLDPVKATRLTPDDLRGLTDTAVLPWFERADGLPVFDRLRGHQRLGGPGGWVTGRTDSRWDFSGSGKHRELASSTEKPGAWKVLMTRHVGRYVIEPIPTQRFINDPALLPERLGVSHERSVGLALEHPVVCYRYPSRNDDSRTLIATFLPADGYLYSTGYAHGVAVEEPTLTKTAALLAVMNSLAIDWWVRRLADRHVTAPIVNALPLPDWTDEQVRHVADIATTLVARLDGSLTVGALGKCRPTSELADCSAQDLEAMIDVAVCEGFGLNERDLDVILSDFSTGSVPPERRARLVSLLTEGVLMGKR